VPPPGSPAPYGQPQYGQPQYGQPQYGQPSYDPGYPQPGYDQPQYGQPGYPPGGDMWGPPLAPPPKKGGSGLLITVIVVLAVLLCGGGAAAIYLVAKDSGKVTATGTPTPNTSGTAKQPTSGPSQGPTGEPTSAPTTDSGGSGALNVRQGDCLVNEGTADKPKLRKSACGPNTYQVLKRLNGTADYNKCAGTQGYTDYYFYDSTVDALDFVLCMKRQ
jgi:hypothetical protein